MFNTEPLSFSLFKRSYSVEERLMAEGSLYSLIDGLFKLIMPARVGVFPLYEKRLAVLREED